MKSVFSLCLIILCLGLVHSQLYTSSKRMKYKGVQEVNNPTVINNMTSAEAHSATLVPEFKGQQVNSGFVQITDSGSSMYFISYSAQSGKADAPFILWLQGGPGCSSWEGNLVELGPYKLIKKDGKLVQSPREYTWNQNYHLLFIDNPLGAGYSYVSNPDDYVTNEDQMAENLYKSLEVFFEKFPEYAKNDFYIFGESYAGHYIPSIGKYILEQIEAGKSSMNLKAVGIGDGWTDPITQAQSYSDFGYANALVDEDQSKVVEQYEASAVKALEAGQMSNAHQFWGAALDTVVQDGGNVNVYNYRDFGPYPDTNTIFLNEEATKEMLHVPDLVSFASCDGNAYDALLGDFMLSMKFKLPYILARIPVLLYNGQDDLICNTPGSENWIRSIEWPYAKDYASVNRSIWKNEDGEIAGYERISHGLVQVIVLKAGHMVPKDQIKNSQNMIERFITYVDGYSTDSKDVNYDTLFLAQESDQEQMDDQQVASFKYSVFALYE